MGLELLAAKSMVRIVRREDFLGKTLLTLGRQFIRIPLAEMEDAFADLDWPLTPPGEITASTFDDACISAESFFRCLGLAEVHALDIDEEDGADILFDLNGEDTPTHLREAFDVVYDGGALQHVFDVKNVFVHVMRMVRTGGLAIHHVPANNYMNHGFYQFSPTLLKSAYQANGFDVEKLFLFYWPDGVGNWGSIGVFDITEQPHAGFFMVDEIRDKTGGWDVFCVARKTAPLGDFVAPQQSLRGPR